MPRASEFYWPFSGDQVFLGDEEGRRMTEEEQRAALQQRDDAVSQFLDEVATLAERGEAGGFASLDSTGKVPTAELADGTANSTTYLRGDRQWVAGGVAYTDEAAQDAIGTILVDTARINFTYSDATPSISADLIAGSIGASYLDFDPATQVELDAHISDISAAHAASAISADSTTLVGVGTTVQAVLEELDDAIAALGGGGYTDEQAQDAVGAMLVDSATIDLTYTDATPALTAAVVDGSITLAKMADLATDRIIGRDTAGTGAPEALTGAQVKTILGVLPPTQTVYTSGSGNYTQPAGCTAIIVELVGGGAAGGGCAGSATQAGAGGGGGSGAYCREIIASPAGPYAYAVGAGGTGVSAAAGNSGASTTFSTLTAPGGGGGPAGTLGTTALANCVRPGGVAAAVATGGDVNSGGQDGGKSFRTSATVAYSGEGGDGPWGGGARYRDDDADGNAATGPGGGGSGAVVSSVNTARTGGAGAAGIIIITEWYA